MDVQIKDRRRPRGRDRRNVDQARFLSRFAVRHSKSVGIAVGVAAQLHPDIEFHVVGQQHRVARRGDQPRRTGDMTHGQAAFKAPRVGDDKFAKPLRRLGFARMTRRVIFNKDKQRPTMHGCSPPRNGLARRLLRRLGHWHGSRCVG